jgi:allantoinase
VTDMKQRALKTHGRFGYRPITRRPDFEWPGGKRLAVYLGLNLEHFEFGTGLGAKLAPSAEPDVLNYAWREYGNRVGAWRMLECLDELQLPAGVLINTSLYDHCPELVAAWRARGDEMIGHGHTNAERQGDMSVEAERALIAGCTARMTTEEGVAPAGWLSPWISESAHTPDLLAEAGYRYTLNWCHDDQPASMQTAHGRLWSVPYPQEVNDIPMIVARQMGAVEFAELILAQYREMKRQSARQALVMGIALHPYLVGQPYRLAELRRALDILAGDRELWWTTPGAICAHVSALGLDL